MIFRIDDQLKLKDSQMLRKAKHSYLKYIQKLDNVEFKLNQKDYEEEKKLGTSECYYLKL